MSLFTRLLVAGWVALAALAAAGMLVLLWALQHSLMAAQAERNLEAARALAQASPWRSAAGDPRALLALAELRWTSGEEDLIVVSGADGRQLLKLQRSPLAADVPQWFALAWPLQADAGAVAVDLGAAGSGRLTVGASPQRSVQLLWSALWRSACGCLGLLVAAGLLWAWLLHVGLRPWLHVQRQVRALAEGATAPLREAGPAELRRAVQCVNAVLRRLRYDSARLTEQVLQLQTQAQRDKLTGLTLRDLFLDRLQQRLNLADAGQSALLLIRVADLVQLNRRVGHDATDRLLQGAAQVVLTYVDRVSGAFAGRLNGSDLALCLPAGGLASETAASLLQGLRALPAARAAGARFIVGGVDRCSAGPRAAALAQADAALRVAAISDSARTAAGGVAAAPQPGPLANPCINDAPQPTAAQTAPAMRDLAGAQPPRSWRASVAARPAGRA